MILDNSKPIFTLNQDDLEILGQLNRLASLELLLPAISHEINNALTFIKLETEPFKIDALESKIERITELSYALQQYSRHDDRVLPIQLNDCLKEALKLTSSLTKNKLQIEQNLLESLPLIKANFQQLKEVLIHLILQLIHSLKEAPSLGNLNLLSQESKNQVCLNFIVQAPKIAEKPIEIELSKKMLAAYRGTIKVENISTSQLKILLSFPLTSP